MSSFGGITYNQHLTLLANARFTLLHYTSQNEQWLASKVNDILKSKGLDSAKPFEKVILLNCCGQPDNQKFENIFTNVITDIGELKSIS